MTRFGTSLLLLFIVVAATSVRAAESQWVRTGATGRLIYVPDAQGDRIMDFSGVGYKGQGTKLIPNNVPNVITLSPVAGDDTAHIQAALDAVAAMPMGSDGFRGAVLLDAGSYDINTQLVLNANGVVLRGVGRNPGDKTSALETLGEKQVEAKRGSREAGEFRPTIPDHLRAPEDRQASAPRIDPASLRATPQLDVPERNIERSR